MQLQNTNSISLDSMQISKKKSATKQSGFFGIVESKRITAIRNVNSSQSFPEGRKVQLFPIPYLRISLTNNLEGLTARKSLWTPFIRYLFRPNSQPSVGLYSQVILIQRQGDSNASRTRGEGAKFGGKGTGASFNLLVKVTVRMRFAKKNFSHWRFIFTRKMNVQILLFS